MGDKLCFNCYEKVKDTAMNCEHCGALFHDTEQDATQYENIQGSPFATPPDYHEEVDKLDRLNKAQKGDETLLARSREKDLVRITILTSVLGILQIYTAGLLDSINEIASIFGIEKTISGFFLIISGFSYFIGMLLFYLSYTLARRLFLIANLVHLFILFRVYGALDVVTFRLNSEDAYDLPPEIRGFLDNISIFMFLMFLFGLCYVFHSTYMYKQEILKVRYRRY
ncbi:MAG: hypothetical protein ACXAD7_03070 [Candidatus Kariarchaeaceae archaeon]